ncbi:class I adenylate-forming enzyme family protein [Kibdelosporangium persicum]|uniref:AMP-dependent Acyl-CoA synthetase and ligase n=1 Tax=Kibdelosporangium persicum TaxID=2698649 RepID=A0ABX2F6D8_9PSEU|nr:AMP-binding protein [Kibdelosporangium persicum]NRN66919.1 AMP-dependent Acyl-CoA synthetase and ligase [Kibdelosporangium persicum]
MAYAKITAAGSEEVQRRAAGGLRAAGLDVGDRVVLSLPTSGVLLAVALGALRSGVVPVMLDPALTATEHAELVADAEAALVVNDQDTLRKVVQGPATELADVPLARPMHYTSGTSGRRKGVWSGVLDETAARALFTEEVELWQFDAADRHLVLGPLYHSAPLRFATHTLLSGGSVLLPDRFDPAAAIAAMAEFRPTTAFCAPTHLKRIFAAGSPSTGSFRLLAHAGEACPDDLKRRVIDTFPADSVVEFYGSTEAQFTVCRTSEWLSRPGTVGRARPGRRLTVDAEGVIWCEVPEHARFSYWRAPDKTAAAWRGARLTVRDTGRLDDDGYLYLDGRRDDLIITGGVNVYPLEIERVLNACPGVRESAVFGVADEHWGQRVCAAVVGDVTTADLAEYAKAGLAPAKRPKDYHLVDELPTSANGKVSRRALPGMFSR